MPTLVIFVLATVCAGHARATDVAPLDGEGQGWLFETIETASEQDDSIGIASLGVALDGDLHVVYEHWKGTDWARRALLWRRQQAGVWQDRELISVEAPHSDPKPHRSNYLPSIAVDATGAPHLSYRRRCRDDEPACAEWRYNVLQHATWDAGGDWVKSRVNDLVYDEGSSTLQISPSGQVLVAYRWKRHPDNDNVGFVASRGLLGAVWDPSCDIAAVAGNQEHVSSALSSWGLPILTCTTEAGGKGASAKRIGLAAASFQAGSDSLCRFGEIAFWDEDKVLLPLGLGGDHMDHSAVAVGGPPGFEDRVHVVANGTRDGDLSGIWYTYADGDFGSMGSWSAPELLGEEGRHPSIEVDHAGTVWVVYQRHDDQLRRERVLVVSGGPQSWSAPEEIDPQGGNQRVEWHEPAIVVDADGLVHILYNRGNQQLRHAWLVP